MAWDDLPDPCDSCIFFTGFNGTDEELSMAIDAVVCDEKDECMEEKKRDIKCQR